MCNLSLRSTHPTCYFHTMSKFGKELIKSLAQAAAHAEGRRVKGVRVAKVEIPDVKASDDAGHVSAHNLSTSLPGLTRQSMKQRRRP